MKRTSGGVVRAGAAALAIGLSVAAATAPFSTPSAYGAATCHGRPVTILVDSSDSGPVAPGTDGDDVVLLTGSGRHSFDARGGDDTICVEGLGSQVTAGTGDDWVSAQATTGPVTVIGGDGNDTITGSDLSDTIFGGRGADDLHGLAGDDTLAPDRADHDHDQVTADAADTVDAGSGDDLIMVSVLAAARTSGADRLQGGTGNDALMASGVRLALDLDRGTLRAAAGGRRPDRPGRGDRRLLLLRAGDDHR